MKKRYWIVLLFLTFSLSGCLGLRSEIEAPTPGQSFGPGMMGSGDGPGSGMMPHNMGSRHHAQVPEAYAGLTNPIPADAESVARGAEIYAAQCATCHGDYGNGDGPGGASLDPAPAPIAHTSQMLSDAYLFWRITEGGIAFETGMLPFGEVLEEQARWDVINFVRALGRGEAHPVGPKIGGQPFDPAQEQAQRLEMLSLAVEQGVITQNEADTFDLVHALMDEYLPSDEVLGMKTGQRADMLPQMLETMLAAQLVTQSQAERFLDVHDRLVEAGLMQ